MRVSSFPSLLFVVAVVACNIGLVIAEEKANSRLRSQDDISASDLQTAHTNAEEDVESIVRSKDEERGVLDKLSSWVSRIAKRAPKGMNVDKTVARESITHVNANIASGEAGKLTQPNVVAMEKHATELPNKWNALTEYISYAFGVAFVTFLLYGAFSQGQRSA